MVNAKRKGWRREDQARKQKEKEGYYVTRAGGSLGVWDLVCILSDDTTMLSSKPLICVLQVKSNDPPSRKEYERMRGFPVFGGLISREVWIYPDRKPVRVEVL